MNAERLLAQTERDLAVEQQKLTQLQQALAGAQVNVQRLSGAVLALRMVLAPEEGNMDGQDGQDGGGDEAG